MKKIIILGGIILLFPAILFAQAKIEGPIWNVGDRWDFGQEGFLEVVGVDKKGYIAKFSAGIFLKSAQGTAIFHKSTFNVLYVLEGGEVRKYKEGFRRILNFPFVIGKKWNDEFTRMSPDGFHDSTIAETIKVLGWEEVVVPAGKFKAIKLEYLGNHSIMGVPGLGESTAWYWYSPEVKYFVKGQYGKGYVETVKPMDPSYKGGREDWKLIFLKLKK